MFPHLRYVPCRRSVLCVCLYPPLGYCYAGVERRAVATGSTGNEKYMHRTEIFWTGFEFVIEFYNLIL